jgi:uncharacterized repeat protein (TIGR03803 family)
MYKTLLMATVATTLLSIQALASTETLLYSFQGGTDGSSPSGHIFQAPDGSLYGTTSRGGSAACHNGCGTVFRLTPNGSGGWNESIIYRFQGKPSDGANPYGGVIMDAAGDLFGITANGGALDYGTVWEIPAGLTQDVILHSFQGNPDGVSPSSGLVADSAGNLYGTTELGGTVSPGGAGKSNGGGVFFRLTNTAGVFSYSVQASFHSIYNTGVLSSPPTIDAAGNIFVVGTQDFACERYSGQYSFCDSSISTGGISLIDGQKARTVGRFIGPNAGSVPISPLTEDSAGNLYGSTLVGGSSGYGVVYLFNESSHFPGANTAVLGPMPEQTLHEFTGNEPSFISGRITLASDGSLYGTGRAGGLNNGGGVWHLTPQPGGGWTESTIWSFGGDGDGSVPLDGVIIGQDGALYGTLSSGANEDPPSCLGGCGAVFRLTP